MSRSVRSPLCAAPTSAMSLCPDSMRASAIRAASMRGGFLAHERARGAGHAMDDRDIAGEQVGELRQKQRRPQIVHQPFVEEGRRGVALARRRSGSRMSTAMSRSPPPAATIMSVRPRISGVALDAGGIQRQPGGIGADALPGFHLALVALFRDLRVEVDRRERMDDVGREGFVVDVDALLPSARPNARPALRRARTRCRCR